MCWIGKTTDKKIADKNTKTFKAMYMDVSKEEPKYYAPLTTYEYELNKLYDVGSIELVTNKCGERIIEKGLHSFSLRVALGINKLIAQYGENVYVINGYRFFDDRKRLSPYVLHMKSNTLKGNFKLVLLVCTIPEGTKYYENEDGEIVSSKLIVTDKRIEV